MVTIFSPEEKNAARREKKKLLIFWFALLAVFLALVITLIVVDIRLVNVYRNRAHTVWMSVVTVIASVLFGGFSLFFFSIKFRLTRKYVKMLSDMERGLKDEIEAKFLGYDESVTMKDGVYFYAMVLDAKPLKREDITTRKVLIEHTKPKPNLTEGTRLRIRSHANILIGYEILGVPQGTGRQTAAQPEAKQKDQPEQKEEKNAQ